MTDKIIIDGNSLTLENFIKVCRYNAHVEISKSAVNKINLSRGTVEQFVNNNDIIYGITTGFGKFSEVLINRNECKLLQFHFLEAFLTSFVLFVFDLYVVSTCVFFHLMQSQSLEVIQK